MANFITVLRPGSPVTTVAVIDIDENTVYNEKIPGTKVITCQVSSQTVLPILEGDYIVWKNEKYFINILPDFDKDSESNAKDYKITFEAEFYQFLDKLVLSSDGLPTFPYYGNARTHLLLIVANANRDSSGWSIGECDDTISDWINYNATYCRAGLDMVAEKFALEYQIIGKVIRMVKTLGVDTGLTLELGRGKGLHKIGRAPDANKNVINRLFAIGGTRNIDSTYRGGKEKNLIITGRYIETAEVTTKTVRPKEGIFEDATIFPKYEGVVTAFTRVNNTDGTVKTVTITDSAIDFDVMTYLQEGVKAKVGMLTGKLMGLEFEISAFDFATKKITLINNTDANGYITPNTLNLPAVGDKFTFYDIRMPVAYVTTAEAKLLAAATVYLNANKLQRLSFIVVPDEHYLRVNGITIKVGDRANVKENDISVNELLRFTEVAYPLVNEQKITAVVGNEIVYDKIIKLFDDIQKNDQQIEIITAINSRTARQNTKDLNSLTGRVFDPDGNLAQGAATLYAAMTKIGFDSQNFGLLGVTILTDIGGNPNTFSVSAGTLVHRIYKVENLGYTWVMNQRNWTGLVAAKYYYVYAKCSATALTGTWEISETEVMVTALPGYYCFNLGQLYEVNADGYRNFDFTKGVTYTVGNTITSGRLQDITKQNFFDVETGQFNLGTASSGIDYGISTPGALTVRGTVVATLANFLNLIVRNLKTKDTGRRYEIIGDDNSATFYDANNRALTSTKDDVDTFIDDDSGTTQRSLAGMTFNKYYSSNPSNPDIVKITGNGIYSNTGFVQARSDNDVGSSAMAFGSVIGYVRRAITLVTGNVHAAIVGLANTSNSFGGYFKHMGGGKSLVVDGITVLNGQIHLSTDGTQVGQSFTADVKESVDTYRYVYLNGVVISRTKLT